MKSKHTQSTPYLFATATTATWSLIEEYQRQRRAGILAFKAVAAVVSVGFAVQQALQDRNEKDALYTATQSLDDHLRPSERRAAARKLMENMHRE